MTSAASPRLRRRRRSQTRGRIALILALVGLLALLGACGGRAAPDTVTEQPADQPAEPGAAAGAATIAPTPAAPTPTPLPTPSAPSIPPYPVDDPNQPPASVPSYTFEILASYPHDPAAYTQGLQYVDGTLYEGTGLTGQSSLRRVELETGTVLQQHNLAPELFGEGITVIDDRIYQLTWQNNVAFLYDRATFAEQRQFTYDTEGWGLTFDGSRLIMSDGSSRLFFRNTESFEVESQLEVDLLGTPVSRINELEYIDIGGIGPEVWANIYQTNYIMRIDPASGEVRSIVDLTGLLDGVPLTADVDVLNGIAYDDAGDRLFVTGKLWPLLFQIRLVHSGWMALTQ